MFRASCLFSVLTEKNQLIWWRASQGAKRSSRGRVVCSSQPDLWREEEEDGEEERGESGEGEKEVGREEERGEIQKASSLARKGLCVDGASTYQAAITVKKTGTVKEKSSTRYRDRKLPEGQDPATEDSEHLGRQAAGLQL